MHVFINGALVEASQAAIAPDDRGFRFGDGVFETIPVYAGLPYLWEYHLERLQGGLNALRILYKTDDLLSQTLTLIKHNRLNDGTVRIQISRGVGSQGYLPLDENSPTVLIETLTRMPAAITPVTLWLSAYEKISPKALPTHYKLAQGLGSTLARMEAVAQDCYDALQLGYDGTICEASSANIFWRRDGILYTPALSCGALAGVTRRRIMELSPYPVTEGHYTLYDLAGADSAILTNTAGLVPIAELKEHMSFSQSALLAGELSNLRNHDIHHYTAKLRESLALR